jgi:hypothetical protein
MPPILIASHFLAGSLLSLLMPVGVLIALIVWYLLAVKRIPSGGSERLQDAPPTAEPQPGDGAPGGGAPSGGAPGGT